MGYPVSFRQSERRRRAQPGEILHPQLSDSALTYFAAHDIAWWGGKSKPTDNPTSSQVACVNHLEPARVSPGLALDVARVAVSDAEGVSEVEDGGFVGYEWIGKRNYLHEKGWGRRGANCTSIDAVIVAGSNGQRTLLLIEWKYAEDPKPGEPLATSEKGTDRVATYRPLLEREDCPILVPGGDLDALFYDPIYQLMRQALLGWQMVEAGELGASDWLHLQVIPEGNERLRNTNPSPLLEGENLAEAWRSVLKRPDRYQLLSPTELLSHVEAAGEWADWRRWLADEYGTALAAAGEG